jgi:hypothetical protein
MTYSSEIKPIKDCPYCRIRPERRKEDFGEKHPKCGACGILMGPGHVEQRVDSLCSTCGRSKVAV